MKRNRLIWVALWILSIVCISFFGGTVSYGFFAITTLVPVVSLFYLLYVYVFFHIYQKTESRNAVVNQSVPFSFQLVNEYPFAFAGVRVKFYSSFSEIDGLNDETEYELLANTAIKKQTTLRCKYRGEYEVGIKTVEIQDYLRLFRISYRMKEKINVIVKPQLIVLDELKTTDAAFTAEDDLYDKTYPNILARSYVEGDDVRQIHWALSAKQGELMVREKTGEKQRYGVSIVIENERVGKDSLQFIPIENKMLEIGLAVAYYYTRNSVPVREYCWDHRLCCANTEKESDFEAFYQTVSDIRFDEEKKRKYLHAELAAEQEFYHSKAVFFVVQELTKEIGNTIDKLVQNGIGVTVYLVTYEEKHTLTDRQNLFQDKGVSLQILHPDDSLEEVM